MTTSDKLSVSHGRCLCGAVQFEIRGPLRPVVYCHCTMCRRATGHFVAASECDRSNLHFISAKALRWYQSSSSARRGFCETCGSQLFWEATGQPGVSIMAGSLDVPTGLRAERHIFTADKGDYYEIGDGLPQKPGW